MLLRGGMDGAGCGGLWGLHIRLDIDRIVLVVSETRWGVLGGVRAGAGLLFFEVSQNQQELIKH